MPDPVRYDAMAVIGVLAVMWVSSLGCGLALERVLRVRLHNALLLPLGLSVSIVLVVPGYALGVGDALAIGLLVTVTLVGLVFAQGGLRTRLNPGWAGAAGLAVYLLYMLPVIANGRWTWSGYDFVNDSAFEMLIADHLKTFGTALGNIPETSAREFLSQYLRNGYPLGTQSLLGTLSGLTDTPVGVLYQGFIGGLAASAAVALATVGRRLLGEGRAAVVAAVALSANLTYQYALQGGIKEIGLLATICAAVALIGESISLGRRYAGAMLVAVSAAAALATYNAVAVPFLGAVVLFAGGWIALTQRKLPTLRWAGPLAVGVGLTALLAIPSLTTFQTFFNVARAGQGATGVGATQLGQLLRPLPLSQLSGVWLSGEYRLPVTPEPAATLTLIATVAILVLVVPSLLWALWRREAGPPLIIGAVGLVLLIVYPRVSPYAQGKLLAVASPAFLLVALIGLASARGRLFPPALLTGLGLALAIFSSDLLAYSHDRVAPTARVEAIQETGNRFRGEGLLLWNEFEEYAKYFARAARISAPFEALTPQQVQLRSPAPFYGHSFDLDAELLSFVERYPIIVTRRGPESRPPANYRLVYENRYYLGWRREARPTVLDHLPESQNYSPSATVGCRELKGFVSHAAPGTELVAAIAPDVEWYEPLYSRDRSPGWIADPAEPGAVFAKTPGHAGGTLTVRHDGRYAVLVQGDFPRAIQVRVDGQVVGTVSGSNTPGQWLQAASLQLRAGPHEVIATRAGGHRHFGPGEWAADVIGAVALQDEVSERLRAVPLDRWRALCATQADWVELVRP
jgi:hypothetical protein